jgi:hypothetical protein
VARYLTYQCPDCDGKFRHLQHPSDCPPPDRCPLCGSWVSEDAPPEPVFVPQAPLIGGNLYGKSIEQVYRQNERASIERSEEAASLLETTFAAQPKDEHDPLVHDTQRHQIADMRSSLKMTNMVDPSSLREGDISAIAPTPQSLTSGGSKAAFQNLGGVMPNHAPGVGPAMVGETTRQGVAAQHASRAQAMTQRGQLAPAYNPK